MSETLTVAQLRLIVACWDRQSGDWYYLNRDRHPSGVGWAGGFEDGWDHAGRLLLDIAAHLQNEPHSPPCPLCTDAQAET